VSESILSRRAIKMIYLTGRCSFQESGEVGAEKNWFRVIASERYLEIFKKKLKSLCTFFIKGLFKEEPEEAKKNCWNMM